LRQGDGQPVAQASESVIRAPAPATISVYPYSLVRAQMPLL